ncbi:AMP-binding protein [Paraglaciecola marina]|uniref:AMP-binding protein n=1 Tax=Paraglaciecola marina TaxID=2500157 RepID=UPI001414D547|nr:AMP-binding protein [Paraglaciecola marina]
MPTLFSHIYTFRHNTAVINDSGEHYSYAKLYADAIVCTEQLGQESKLVFINARNNYSTVVAYVACMLGGHPVLLVAADNPQQLEELVNSYQPNFIVNTLTDTPEFKVYNSKTVQLHNELCLLLSTSGSTGSPKLVKISHSNIISNSDAIIRYLEVTTTDRAITSLPIHYSYGLSILNIHLRVGASIVLTDLSVTNENFWKIYKQFSVTSFSGVPYSFQALLSVNFDFSSAPSTRYVTQAGGKLSQNVILHFANQLKLTNKLFFIMYGQTEASPRISYLPPDQVFEHSDCIGIAIYGGSLTLHDDKEKEITDSGVAGELIYRGPNIMMGYALGQNDFASMEYMEALHTGDIALRKSNGLFKIIGRVSRFVKPFGIRVNLDDIQNNLSNTDAIVAVTGNDEKILVVIQTENETLISSISHQISLSYTLPLEVFQIEMVSTIPRLSNDKFDYKYLLKLFVEDVKQKSNTRLFLDEFKKEVLILLGVAAQPWNSVADIYSSILNNPTCDDLSTFRSLSGDSLSYVAVSSALNQYLGNLPDNWHNMSIQSLQDLRYGNEF